MRETSRFGHLPCDWKYRLCGCACVSKSIRNPYNCRKGQHTCLDIALKASAGRPKEDHLRYIVARRATSDSCLKNGNIFSALSHRNSIGWRSHTSENSRRTGRCSRTIMVANIITTEPTEANCQQAALTGEGGIRTHSLRPKPNQLGL